MRHFVISAALLSLALASAPAAASGTGGGGGFGGGFGSGSASSSRISEADRLANRGRSQVRKRITCKKCQYHKRLNQQTAPEVARAVREGKFKLSERNRTAVLFFLRQRYGV
jgi:hypothetical protein